MNTVQEKWESYQREVLPKNASQAQVTERRRGFYAGSLAMLQIVTGMADAGISDAAGGKIVDGLYDELLQFVEQIGKTT